MLCFFREGGRSFECRIIRTTPFLSFPSFSKSNLFVERFHERVDFTQSKNAFSLAFQQNILPLFFQPFQEFEKHQPNSLFNLSWQRFCQKCTSTSTPSNHQKRPTGLQISSSFRCTHLGKSPRFQLTGLSLIFLTLLTDILI